MAERIARELVAERAIVHETATLRLPIPTSATGVDRSFKFPTGLYVAMVALFSLAIGVMAFGFEAPGMIIPTGIIAVFIAMVFGVPAQWVRMKPENPQRAASWARFLREGIMTPYGRSAAGAAAVQMLILPTLILIWGLAVVTIAAVVR